MRLKYSIIDAVDDGARQLTLLGHEVKLMPPSYVKPCGGGIRMTLRTLRDL
jgi:hypothetical protein